MTQIFSLSSLWKNSIRNHLDLRYDFSVVNNLFLFQVEYYLYYHISSKICITSNILVKQDLSILNKSKSDWSLFLLEFSLFLLIWFLTEELGTSTKPNFLCMWINTRMHDSNQLVDIPHLFRKKGTTLKKSCFFSLKSCLKSWKI